MNKKSRHRYEPDSVTPPGDTLQATLDALGMTQKELAEQMGRPQKFISDIVNAEANITAETALQLEQVLGITASFWLRREQRYSAKARSGQ
jgi:addiction module HigA family antidote